MGWGREKTREVDGKLRDGRWEHEVGGCVPDLRVVNWHCGTQELHHHLRALVCPLPDTLPPSVTERGSGGVGGYTCHSHTPALEHLPRGHVQADVKHLSGSS